MIDSLAERLAINFTSIVTRNEIDPADVSKRPSYRMEPKAAAVGLTATTASPMAGYGRGHSFFLKMAMVAEF